MKDLDRTKTTTSRRNFVKAMGLSAVGFTIVPRHTLGGVGYVPPSDKVNIGVVGVGGRGKENVSDLLKIKDAQITCIADPAQYWDLAGFYYKTTAGRGPVKKMVEDHYSTRKTNSKVTEYSDFREMLDKESALDAVLCATPDHTHAYVTLQAMRAGKHVYCEKPLTHNLWEARMVRKVAKETGMATQMGNQLHSTPNIRNAVEYLRAGVVGKVKEVHSWVPATRWIKELEGMPGGTAATPKGLDWDLWLGPRSKRSFNEAYAPVTWRDFWEFGCGALGDFGCHDMDAATWGLDLPSPESVEVHPAGFSDENITPYGEIGYYQFPAHKGNPPVYLNWYSGGLRPPLPEMVPEDFTFARRGAMYVGEKGVMITGGNSPVPQVFPKQLDESFKMPEATISATNGHHQDWVDAIKGGAAASSNFEYATRLTEITLLGVLSLRLGGQKIYWDSDNLEAKGLPEANRFIREAVREGWEMD